MSKQVLAKLTDARAPAFIKWKQQKLFTYAGSIGASQFRFLPGAEDEYALVATETPKTAGGELDVSAVGKEKRRQLASDVTIGPAIQEACALSDVKHLLFVESDKGRGSFILRRLDKFFQNGVSQAIQKLRKKLNASYRSYDDSLQPAIGMQRWWPEVHSIYEGLRMLCTGGNAKRLPSEVLVVGGPLPRGANVARSTGQQRSKWRASSHSSGQCLTTTKIKMLI